MLKIKKGFNMNIQRQDYVLMNKLTGEPSIVTISDMGLAITTSEDHCWRVGTVEECFKIPSIIVDMIQNEFEILSML